MKNTSITKFLVLALAIMMAISPMSAFAEDTSASIDLIPWMHTAYQSIDSFDPDPAMKPSVEDINTIMEAACLAQSSTNTQPWYFLVLTDSTQYDVTKTGLGCATFNEGLSPSLSAARKPWAAAGCSSMATMIPVQPLAT